MLPHKYMPLVGRPNFDCLNLLSMCSWRILTPPHRPTCACGHGCADAPSFLIGCLTLAACWACVHRGVVMHVTGSGCCRQLHTLKPRSPGACRSCGQVRT